MKSFMTPYLQGYEKTHYVPIRWIYLSDNLKYFTWYDPLFTVQIEYTKNNVIVLIHDNYLHFISWRRFTTIKDATDYIDYELSILFNEKMLKNFIVGDLHEFTLIELLVDNNILHEFDSLCF